MPDPITSTARKAPADHQREDLPAQRFAQQHGQRAFAGGRVGVHIPQIVGHQQSAGQQADADRRRSVAVSESRPA